MPTKKAIKKLLLKRIIRKVKVKSKINELKKTVLLAKANKYPGMKKFGLIAKIESERSQPVKNFMKKKKIVKKIKKTKKKVIKIKYKK